MKIKEIKMTKYYIYPAIGIARVGNSTSDFMVTPEVRNPEVPNSTEEHKDKDNEIKYKDDYGRVKRHAAKFRIYEMNDDGTAKKEITHKEGVEIEWRVHLANRKAIGYQFNNAMDLGSDSLNCELRNSHVRNLEERTKKLLLDPGKRIITGCNRDSTNSQDKENFVFDTAKFYEGTSHERNVYLGELRTDAEGRLLVLGGYGESNHYEDKPANTFANNDGWHDDVSDGTVRATITINGKEFIAEPAMVAVTPPNFAPGMHNPTSLLDVVENTFKKYEDEEKRKKKELIIEDEVIFYRDIYPIFKSLVDNQGVNFGFHMLFGLNSSADFTAKSWLKKLSDPSNNFKTLREVVFKQFRPSESKSKELRDKVSKYLDNSAATLKEQDTRVTDYVSRLSVNLGIPIQDDGIPGIYGDTFGDYKNHASEYLSLTDKQYDALTKWVKGEFKTGKPQKALEGLCEVETKYQPQELTKAHLSQCLGGPFHPGIELTWFIRLISMWDKDNPIDKMRLNIVDEDESPVDYFGRVLTPEKALADMFNSSGPGTLTRFMGVPWQTDEASCRSAQDYDPALYLPLPTFWSARVPNQVLSKRSYDIVKDRNQDKNIRLNYFNYRQDWMRFFNTTNYLKQVNSMVKDWDKLGIVRQVKANNLKDGEDGFVWVEGEVDEKYTVDDPTYSQVLKTFNMAQYNTDTIHASNKYEEELKELEKNDIEFNKKNKPRRKTFNKRADLFK